MKKIYMINPLLSDISFSLKLHSFKEYLVHSLTDEVSVTVLHSHNSIGSFLRSFNEAFIYEQYCAVHTGELYHFNFPLNNIPTPPEAPPRAAWEKFVGLSLQVYELFKHRVGSGDDSCVCLIASLSYDHIGELICEVNV